MLFFPVLMVLGLAGLALMALAGFGRHGHPGGALHGLGQAARGGAHLAHGHSAGAHSAGTGAARADGATGAGWLCLIPSPVAIFSLMTLFGAFGYLIARMGHFVPLTAGLLAAAPTLLTERFAVKPLWNLLFRFQGTPSASLDELVFTEATAVTSFRNGRGLVSVERDGRAVQFRAELAASQAALPVRVGDTLLIDEVDASKERVTVSLR